ncbi:MAG: DUF4422 domain-containing protein [Bacteroidales bacterium]|nr:DUF4422 domain-containing protein [Bacteroidales bacterium]
MTNIWITYHCDTQIEEFHLQEDDTYHLFRGNDTNIEGDNINYLNPFYSELVTLYWVWKNNRRSDFVGFCHYRRKFTHLIPIESGQCQVLAINNNCYVFGHFKAYHNYQDYYDAIDVINDKYGDDNKYTNYLLKSKTFVPFCCFVMRWEDFCSLCEWLFPILFALDKKWGMNMKPEKYIEKACRDFRYDNIQYQQRAMSFLAERLISCYIVAEMKPFYVQTLLR